MYKRHTYEDCMKYMHHIEEGYSFTYIHTHFGISSERLKSLWIGFHQRGEDALRKKPRVNSDIQTKLSAIDDYEKKGLSLMEVMLKYNVSECALYQWRQRYAAGGAEALRSCKTGRPPGTMGRPKKKGPQTDLERLQAENERLRAENALLKKVKALVEEREARLREIGRKPSRS